MKYLLSSVFSWDSSGFPFSSMFANFFFSYRYNLQFRLPQLPVSLRSQANEPSHKCFPARISGLDDENNIPEDSTTLENLISVAGCKTAPLWASECVPLIRRTNFTGAKL